MKILIVQTAFLGDVILSTPFVKALHEIYPNAEFSLVTTKAAAPLVQRDPLLKHIIIFDKRNNHSGISGLRAFARELQSYKFDCVYSLHRSARTSLLLWMAKIPLRIGFSDSRLAFLYHRQKKPLYHQHSVLRRLALLEGEGRYDQENTSLRLFSPAQAEVKGEIAALMEGNQRRILVFPGSEWETKQWHWSQYRKVAAHYLARGFQVIVVGGAKERAVADAVCIGNEGITNLAGLTRLDEVLFLVKNASLVICNDSMALHMAAAFKIPVAAVFCSTTPAFGFGPWQTPSRVVERSELACRPCRRHGGRVCPIGTEACMRMVLAEEVIQACDELLNAG